MAVSLLAVLKAGCCYVPLDPSYPEERLSFMVEDSNARVVLTQQRLSGRLPNTSVKIVCVDSEQAELALQEQINPVRTTGPDDIAYIIYTSGSTGKPKGVAGRHRGAINRFSWMWKTYPFKLGELCCQKTSLGFVDSVWEMFGPLLDGTPALLIPDPVVHD